MHKHREKEFVAVFAGVFPNLTPADRDALVGLARLWAGRNEARPKLQLVVGGSPADLGGLSQKAS